MAVRPRLDRSAILAGAAVGVAVAVITIMAWQALRAVFDLEESNLVFVFYLVVAAGWVAGGWVAGRREPDAPLTHGALSGLVAFVPVALFGIALSIARGHGADIFAIVPNALVAATAGVIGGFLAGFR